MNEVNHLFRKRIGLGLNEHIHFDMLGSILKKTAASIPFENLSIISGTTGDAAKDNLIHKILIKNEGGLCYELNPLLYYFLVENGFEANLVRGVVFNQQIQNWSETGRTHTAIVLKHNQQSYLIDTGFGLKLPLIPVPLNGGIVSSNTGDFQVSKIEHCDGDYIFKMKLKDHEEDWQPGYVFDSMHPIKNSCELTEIGSIICEHPSSSFNKSPLITRLTNNGYMILTRTSFTHSENGQVTKETFDRDRFKEMARVHFGLFC